MSEPNDTTNWLRSGEYLPPFLRDFHDQKDVFKALDEVLERRRETDSYTRDLSWVAAQVFTVDVFLWMMARHGWTLQRSRKRVPFSDLAAWISAAKGRRNAIMAKALGLTPLHSEPEVLPPQAAEDEVGT